MIGRSRRIGDRSGAKGPDELRRQLGRTRTQLGRTVAQLIDRTDVRGRTAARAADLRDKAGAMTVQLRASAAHAGHSVQDRAAHTGYAVNHAASSPRGGALRDMGGRLRRPAPLLAALGALGAAVVAAGVARYRRHR
ncbi:DUF3618 domain-containing protein [Streptomyces sp. J2-1]|uniref:DUF3618 domain-containing protein n=1 Tax=Streptomyces corallincola TaxID=2851888 RepID=UPI001C391464|nr:DUF3618 domain-containing protein [Streptomyces corallincola]MBV2355156.1 DUF3618 domain-containing protein [Streptomyces corallincola]